MTARGSTICLLVPESILLTSADQLLLLELTLIHSNNANSSEIVSDDVSLKNWDFIEGFTFTLFVCVCVCVCFFFFFF